MSSEVVGSSARSRAPCDSCTSQDGRYTCPACNVRSCSLKCVNHHKEIHNCTGKRSKTEYVPLSEYNDTILRNDYFFLENIIRYTDSTSRDKIKHLNYQNWKRKQNMSKLKYTAKSRDITLYLAPIGLTSHQLNTSRVHFDTKTKKQTILWKIQWNFIDCDIKYNDKCVSEYTIVKTLLDKYIHPTSSDPIIRHKLRQYVKLYNDVKVYMKVEKSKCKSFYLLDKDISLLDNLKGKLILEHPIIWVSYIVQKDERFPLYNESSAPAQYSVPSTAQYSVPSTAQYSVPSTAQYSVPSTAQYSVPSTAQYSVPSTAQYSVPSTAQYSVPSTAQYSVPSTAQYSVPSTVQYSVPSTAQYSVPSTVQCTLPSRAQYTLPLTGLPSTAQYNAQYTLPATAQYNAQYTLPATAQCSLPSTAQCNAQYTLPTTAQYNAQYTLPATAQYNAQYTLPATAQYTLPTTAQYTLPTTAQYTLPSTAQYSVSFH